MEAMVNRVAKTQTRNYDGKSNTAVGRSMNQLSKSLLLKRTDEPPAQTHDLAYRDFMPRDVRGLPVEQGKPGAHRFQVSLGSCHDRRIEEEVLY